jgi:hypothetical protein
MSKSTASIVGTTGASFTATLDSGKIQQAHLGVIGQPLIMLQVGADSQSVIVPSLPAGDSTVWLAIVWAPGDPNANVGVTAVTSGQVIAPPPPGVVYDNNPSGAIEMFGVAAGESLV